MACTQRPPGRTPLPSPLPSPLPLLLLLLGLVLNLTWADVAPSLLEEPESALLSGHHQVALQCRVAPPGAAVRWFFQGRPLDPAEHEGLVVEANRLVFDPPAHIPPNAGSYRCLATSGLGSILSRAAVLSLPVLEEFAPGEDVQLNGTEGGFAVLPCLLPRSLPPASALFIASDGRQLNTTRDGVYQLPSGSVVIRNLRRSDAGNFRCVAVNPSTQENVTSPYSLQLDVTPPPPGGEGSAYTQLVGAASREVGVQVGQGAVLECPSLAFPRPLIKWSKYPGTLPQHRASVSDGNLHLKNVGLGDGGTYLCEVGKTKRVVQLNVQELPTVQVNHTQMQVSVGQRVDLHCKVRGYPEVKVSWFHNAQEKQRPQPVSPEGSTWTIARAGLADAGVYQCVAANNASSAYATIVLQVSQPSRVSGSRTGMSTTDTSGDGISDDEDIASPSSRKKDRRRKKKKGRRKNLKGRTKPRKNRKNDGKAKLVPPSRPEVTLLSETSVMLNWTVPENDGLNVVFFRVQYKEVSPSKGQWRTDETDIDPNKRRWEVNRLKSGGTYKFRIAAVYSNNDNKHSPNSKRFMLSVASRKEPRPPEFSPKIVEVKPIVHENVYALHVKWQYHPVDKTPVAGFMIKYREWGQGEEGWKEVPLVGSGIRTHLLTHLKPDTDYEIKMQCFNSAGSSKDSNKVAYRTSSPDNNKSPPFPFPTHSSNNPPPFPSDSPGGEGGGRGKGGRENEDEGSGPPPSNTQSNSEMLYMILGIVLGAMLLLLVIFMAMCWWRQRQQRRADAGREGDAIHPNKFHDQAYRIHHDSMRKKTMNGYPLNGLNGLVANGHGPNHNHKVNISVNPLSEVEGGQTYPGSHALPNGHGPLMYGNHGSNSDNNFNSIRQGKPGVTTAPGEPSLHQADSDQEEDLEDEDSAMLPDPSPSPLHFPHPLSRPPYSSNPELAPRVSPRPRLPVSFEHLHTADGGLERGERYPLGVYQGRERGYAPCSQHSSSSQGRSRKRRKRPHSREHSTKDQATNTDLSSNEGTIEFTTFNRSPTGSDHSRTFTNNSTQCSDVIRTSEAL